MVSKMTSRKIFVTGTSLPGQWLGLHISTAGSTQVQSLVRDLRSHKPHTAVKKKKKTHTHKKEESERHEKEIQEQSLH